MSGTKANGYNNTIYTITIRKIMHIISLLPFLSPEWTVDVEYWYSPKD
jgi:hypothetical protein